MKHRWVVLYCGILLTVSPVSIVAADSGDNELDPGHPQTVVVNCHHGGSVQRALRRRARELRIEIRGRCEESIIIERDRVTLFGTDPGEDGLVGVEGFPNTVMIRGGVFDIRIENLELAASPEGGAALGTGASFRVEVVGSRVHGRGGIGAFIGKGSFVYMENTTLSDDGGSSALWVSGGAFTGQGLSLSDLGSGGRALTANQGATVRLSASSLEGKDGIRATGGSLVNLNSGSEILISPATSGGGRALWLDQARVSLGDSTFEGAIQATLKSQVALIASSQTGPAGSVHRFRLDSMLQTLGTTAIEGDLLLDEFSKAVLDGTTSIAGTLACDAVSDAVCSGTVTALSSSCLHCPLP